MSVRSLPQRRCVRTTGVRAVNTWNGGGRVMAVAAAGRHGGSGSGAGGGGRVRARQPCNYGDGPSFLGPLSAAYATSCSQVRHGLFYSPTAPPTDAPTGFVLSGGERNNYYPHCICVVFFLLGLK